MTASQLPRISQTYRAIHAAVTLDHHHPAAVGTMFGMHSASVLRIVARVDAFDAYASAAA